MAWNRFVFVVGIIGIAIIVVVINIIGIVMGVVVIEYAVIHI